MRNPSTNFTQPVFSNASIFGTDTIRVATIGVNGMGWANTKAALKVKNVKNTANQTKTF